GLDRHGQRLPEDRPHHLGRGEAVLARVWRCLDRDHDLVALLERRERVPVGRQRLLHIPQPLLAEHRFQPPFAAVTGAGSISTELFDHSPNTRKTIEIAALRAPATMIGTSLRAAKYGVNSSAGARSASLADRAPGPLPDTPSLPARRRSASTRPTCLISQSLTSPLE